ncbi:MAG TPA: PilZ domain-containing protein [Candidatus Solibacter sp.]|jgi:CheY-like chemotaxis protein|nr:PilZ domain-containing protein [Candidatus Solibacter sp.]
MVLPEANPTGAGAAHEERQSLDFLVVCDDYQALREITKAVGDSKGKVSCAPSPASAQEYIARRKLDGIIIDLRVDGALELIEAVRKGSSNKFSVVFACVASSGEATLALSAGANFVVHHPFTAVKLGQVFQSAAPMMAAEKRRYFRYPLAVPVNLKAGSKEFRASMSNLSEGGMAIWCLQAQQMETTISFSFELPFGGQVQGRGEVTWANTEGLVGIKFHYLADGAYQHLKNWLDQRIAADG